MSKHQWIAVFTVSLTDEEAAKAYLSAGASKYNLMAKKITFEDVGKHGGVDIGCYVCEQPYQLIRDKPCIPDSSIKDS
jgi:hypothetical protein